MILKCAKSIDNFAHIQYITHILTMEGKAMARKTIEERIAAIDTKIANKKAEIEELEVQKQKLLHPVNMKTVMAKAKEAGLTPEDIAEKLGLEV